MLIAKNIDGDFVSLVTVSQEEMPQHRGRHYYCPCCHQKVRLKAGSVKIPHFAHVSNMDCQGGSEGETIEHLMGKKHFYEWLSLQGYAAELEKYFPDFQQRADLYFTHESQQYAIEFQCSSISIEQLIKRSSMYRKYQIEPIWIFSSHFVKRKRTYTFALSSFHWHAISHKDSSPTLFFYSPFETQWTILSQLTPFSSRQILSRPLQYSLQKLTFPQLIQTKTRLPIPIQDWMCLKQKWRLQASLYAQSKSFFFHALYRTQIYPATFPNEIGIPVPYSYLFETSVIEWQFWLYESVLYGKSPGTLITNQQWKVALLKCLRDKRITLRMSKPKELIQALIPVHYYVEMLVQLGVLKPIGKGKYILSRLVENFNPEEPNQEKVFFKCVASSYDRVVEAVLKH